MSTLSDDQTSDDGQTTEPLAVVEATLDDGGDDDVEPETTTGDDQTHEPQSTEQAEVHQPPSDERVTLLLPKRGRPRGPGAHHPPKGSRPRGRPPLGTYSPRMPAPASDTYKPMLQIPQPKTYSNRSNSTPPPTTLVATPISTSVVQLPTPSNPTRPRRGRPSLASQTPRMPGPASEFYKALVDMHDCLKWDRKVLYRYERHPASSNSVGADATATPDISAETVKDSESNSTSAQSKNDRAEEVVTEVKEEPALDSCEENNVTIGSSFSLTGVPSEEQPSACSETPSTGDKDDSNGSVSDGGNGDKSKRLVTASGTASVSTYYLLSGNRGLNRKCVVPSCLRPLDPHFSFPKDKNLCLKWLLAIPKGNWSLTEQSVVCARHFDRTDINWKTRMANSVTLTVDAVPKLYLLTPAAPFEPPNTVTSPTLVNKNVEAVVNSVVNSARSPADSSAKSSTASSPTADGSVTEPMADISETQDVSLVQQGNGVFKIEMGENDSESDLEIIEPHIETYEVSDTSDEGESTENKKDENVTAGANDDKNNLPISIVGINSQKDVSSTGKLYNRHVDGNVIKCCVPRCGSFTGSPTGVGFHTFPVIGETRLSVRSLDNKVTVHDLCSMWKSLLSVPNVTEDSYVCTRHFTVNDYIYNTLNKAAVPTQFLPTPVMFAPCRVDKSLVTRPPSLVYVRNPQQQPSRHSTIRIRAPTILRGASRAGAAPSTLSQIQNRIVNHVVTVAPNNRIRAIGTQRVSSTLSRPTGPTMPTPAVPQLLPKPAVMRFGCAIPDCPNRTYEDKNKPIFFRLPPGLEKCKEWVYSCGHPEWLDKGMFYARAKFRICAEHFSDDMFLGSDRKMLKGFAKPCIRVQEPFKKCVVKSCHNYYDKERLHHIGVDFSPFPDRKKHEKRLIQWIHAVKSSDDDLAEEELAKYENSVICSLHFRNGDYVPGPVGKRLSSNAIPSMNLVGKEPLRMDDNEDQGEEMTEEQKKKPPSRKMSRRKRGQMLAKRWHQMRIEKEKALAEGRPWPPVNEEKEAKKRELEEEAAKRREARKKRWEELPQSEKVRFSTKNRTALRLSRKPRKRGKKKKKVAAVAAGGVEHEQENPTKRLQPVEDDQTAQADTEGSKRQKLDEEGDTHPECGSQQENELGSRRGKGRGHKRNARSKSGNTEDSSENESMDGSWASENEGRQLRFGRKARPLRQAVLCSSKGSKYAGSEDGESSGSGRQGRKKRRLEEETIYTQAHITRASARAAAAKNKKIYAEDSDSDNQEECDNDQGVPDEDYKSQQEAERPQGTHFLDPDFGGLEDMAMDRMDTLENCLETVLVEQSQENSLGPPDLGPPEKGENVTASDQNKEDISKETKDSEVSIENPDAVPKIDEAVVAAAGGGSQIQTEAVVAVGKQLRFRRKARRARRFTRKKRRGRRGRSNVTGAEEADPQADDTDRSNSEVARESLHPAVDVENTDCRVPVCVVVEEPTEKDGSTPGTVAGADISEEDVTEQPPVAKLSKVAELNQKDNHDEIPANQDTEASPPSSEVRDPPGKTSPSPVEKPPDPPHRDEGQDPSQDDSKENEDTNCVPYGPKLPVPTQADVEFFRSIIPTMAKFNQHQRAILKATVISTLKDMLGEDIGVKLNTTEVLLNALPLPASPE